MTGARAYLTQMEVNDETLAMDAIRNVGPGGHFLGQKHTRNHMKTLLTRSVTHQSTSATNTATRTKLPAREFAQFSKPINPNRSKRTNKPNSPASSPPPIRN